MKTMVDRSKTNITALHERRFQALTSGEFANFALFSCFVNGEPTTAIVYVEVEEAEDFETIFNLNPIFVAVTDGMKLTDHDGASAVWKGGNNDDSQPSKC
jgi:hypothetical protein